MQGQFTQSTMIQDLYQEICRQNTIYMAIIAIVIGLFGIFQWRLSENKIKRIKDDAVNSIAEKYDLKRIDQLNDEIKNLKIQISKDEAQIDDFAKIQGVVVRNETIRVSKEILGEAMETVPKILTADGDIDQEVSIFRVRINQIAKSIIDDRVKGAYLEVIVNMLRPYENGTIPEKNIKNKDGLQQIKDIIHDALKQIVAKQEKETLD